MQATIEEAAEAIGLVGRANTGSVRDIDEIAQRLIELDNVNT